MNSFRYFPTQIAVHHFLDFLFGQFVAQQEHQLRDGTFGRTVVAAYHPSLYQGQARLVESHVNTPRLALRDVDHEETPLVRVL